MATDRERARDDANGAVVNDDTAQERFAAIMRFPKRAALISGILVPLTAAVNLFVLEDTSMPLFAVTVISAVVCLLAMVNVIRYSPRVMARLSSLAPHVGGRFTLWKAGAGGYAGVPFAYGAEHERFGMLNYDVRGVPIEIGHLSSQVSARYRAPTGRRHPYIVVRLPERMPHMILSFGHLSRVLGVRVAPDQWHRSQRVDVGFARRGRLFVGDGGEHVARAFFSPEMVQLLQRTGRYFDVEIKDRNLYLFPSAPVTAGAERRRDEKLELIEELATSVAGSKVWDLVRRQSRGTGPRYEALRADIARSVAIVFGIAGVFAVVLSLIVLNARGLLG